MLSIRCIRGLFEMTANILPSYREMVQLLDSFQNFERSVPSSSGAFTGGLERMGRLLKRLGSPHAGIPAVHIAGTKGKGSISHLTAAALNAAGLKTGLYSSPHVENLRERIAVGGRPVDEQAFAEAGQIVIREAEAMAREGQRPTWFEVMTAVALMIFREAKVAAMVLETGLGGRLDATNLPDLRVAACGLAAISMDHEDILGHTLTAIAAEKAAIIRRGVPVVTAVQEKSVAALIADKARERNAPLLLVGRDVLVGVRKAVVPDKPFLGQHLDLETRRNVYPDISLALLGRHQAENAAMALGLADLFLEYMDREPLDSLVLKRAWRNLILPARLEVAAREPWHIIDGAHNPASAWAASETLSEAFTAATRTMIFGVAVDKDWRTMLRILASRFGHIVLTPFHSPRAVDTALVAEFLGREYPGIKIASAIDPAHALELARGFTPRDGLILTTGSLYLAGEMRVLCRKELEKADRQ